MLEPHTLPDYAQNFGFWLVDNEMVFSKVKSILRAQERNTRDVRYYFYDHVYNKCDWTYNSIVDLNTFYVERAVQLRNKYDYLVMLYSGGSDSSNALKTFLYNNIKLDEVAYWYTSYNEDSNITNLELIHAASNILERVRDEYGIPVRKLDERQHFISAIKDSDWVLSAEPTLVAAQLSKQSLLNSCKDWLKLSENGKRIGLILGLEKPRIFYDNGWFASFLDVAHGWNNEINHLKKQHYTIESFYMTPDKPDITIKQCHVLKNYINQNYTVEQINSKFNHINFSQDEYNKLCRTLLYPHWNDSTYSLGKSINKPPLTQKYEWVWKSNTQTSENYHAGLHWLNDKVDPYWCNGGDFYRGFVGCWSRRYILDA
jgi:hypothetical protein